MEFQTTASRLCHLKGDHCMCRGTAATCKANDDIYMCKPGQDSDRETASRASSLDY